MASSVEIRPVDQSKKKELKAFIKFPWKIYKGNKNWVPPLIFDQLEFFDLKKNPYFLHSRIQLFMAYRDGKPVGRICAHENKLHTKARNDGVGFFGFFECIDDQEVASALFDWAVVWLKGRGLEHIRGPASLSMNRDEVGLLLDVFDQTPMVKMPYNPPYYQRLIEGYGFKKIQDLWAYYIFDEMPERIRRIAEFVEQDPDIVVRQGTMKDFDQEVEKIGELWDQAWEENWGAVPLTEKELEHVAKELKLILDPQYSFIAEVKGKPVGFSLAFPDINQALIHANGRLIPFGLLKILWYRRKINKVRVFLMGVLKEYRNRGIDSIFYVRTYDIGRKNGIVGGELSWILESNSAVTSILKKMGVEVYKTYRLYQQSLS